MNADEQAARCLEYVFLGLLVIAAVVTAVVWLPLFVTGWAANRVLDAIFGP